MKKCILVLFFTFFNLVTYAQSQVDTRIAAVFRSVFNDPRVYLENRCQDNIARFLLVLEQNRVQVEPLYAVEITNAGLENFGLVAAQTTRIYPQNWGHHVVLYDGTYIYDFDFTKTPTPTTPAKYFHKMFKTDSQKVNRTYCDKALGAYKITFRPAYLYLNRYGGRKIPAGYIKEPVEKRMRDLVQWGCDSGL